MTESHALIQSEWQMQVLRLRGTLDHPSDVDLSPPAVLPRCFARSALLRMTLHLEAGVDSGRHADLPVLIFPTRLACSELLPK